MGNQEIIDELIDNARLFSSLSDDSINRIISIVRNWVQLNGIGEIPPELISQIIEYAIDELDSYDTKNDARIVTIEEAVENAINKVVYDNELNTNQITIK